MELRQETGQGLPIVEENRKPGGRQQTQPRNTALLPFKGIVFYLVPPR